MEPGPGLLKNDGKFLIEHSPLKDKSEFTHKEVELAVNKFNWTGRKK